MSRKIGALWVRSTKEGVKYMSGVLNDLRGEISIAIFKNDRKEKENQPDYNIIVSERSEKPIRKESSNQELPEINVDESKIKPEDLPF